MIATNRLFETYQKIIHSISGAGQALHEPYRQDQLAEGER
jgi:hypothetical protein